MMVSLGLGCPPPQLMMVTGGLLQDEETCPVPSQLKLLKGRPRWGDVFVSLEPYRAATPDDPSCLCRQGGSCPQASIGIFFCGTLAARDELSSQCALRGPAFRFHGD